MQFPGLNLLPGMAQEESVQHQQGLGFEPLLQLIILTYVIKCSFAPKTYNKIHAVAACFISLFYISSFVD